MSEKGRAGKERLYELLYIEQPEIVVSNDPEI